MSDLPRMPFAEAAMLGVTVRPSDRGYVVTDDDSGEVVELHGDVRAVKNFIIGVTWAKRCEQSRGDESRAAGGGAE